MQRYKGFSLLEILVAFSIMAIALTVLLRIFGTGVNNAVISEEYTLGMQIAESLMARTGVETALETGESQGTEGDKYDWLVTISPSVPASARRSLRDTDTGQQQAGPELMSVRVRVGWGEEEQPRVIELNTLKLKQQGQG